jgi:hypothetical protein
MDMCLLLTSLKKEIPQLCILVMYELEEEGVQSTTGQSRCLLFSTASPRRISLELGSTLCMSPVAIADGQSRNPDILSMLVNNVPGTKGESLLN